MRQQTRVQTRRRGRHTEDSSRDRWLITYSDLITLLLIFFIMMYAMSTLDKSKYTDIIQSLQTTFSAGDSILEQGSGVTGTADSYTHKNPNTVAIPQPEKAEAATKLTEREQAFREQELELQGLMSVISTYVTDNKLQNQIFVADEPQGISITLSDQFVFDAGRADLKPESAPVLAKLASLFKNLGTTVSIEGHTDNLPITYSPKYHDNWDLSGARALSILRFFLEKGHLSPEGFQYAGYADTRPVGDNTTTEGRQNNRRVEIIVLRQLQKE